MNSRQLRKQARIEHIKRVFTENPQYDETHLVSQLICQFYVSEKIAREEVKAVKVFLGL